MVRIQAKDPAVVCKWSRVTPPQSYPKTSVRRARKTTRNSSAQTSVTVVAPARGSGAIARLRVGVREAIHGRVRVRHVRPLSPRPHRRGVFLRLERSADDRQPRTQRVYHVVR
eukprot:scaffold19002_cov36-Phaeocystis_antarctica.AAC.1